MKTYRDSNYDDIINLQHHISTKHSPMSMIDRAAQFSPFAALTGHNDAVQETARLTEDYVELDENSKELLDREMQKIIKNIGNHPNIEITYFAPDKKKSGGEYVTVTGRITKLNDAEQCIIIDNEIGIFINSVYAIKMIDI